MSLLTQCPACSTLYRVVPDQLRISEGWVKCGQCSEIFDASKHLMESADLPPADAGLTTNSKANTDNPDQSQADDQVADKESVASNAPPTSSVMSTEHETETISATGDHIMPPPPQEDAVADEIDHNPHASDEQVTHPPPSDELTTRFQLRWDDHSDDQEDDLELQEVSDNAGSMPSFLAVNDVSTHLWQRPWVRGMLMASMVILTLTLAAQWLHFEKDRLAAQHPEMKMALTIFCTLSNCTVEPLQRIENLSVDSVGFSQLGKNSYRLNFVVKNSSPLALSMPAVELSLTDAQDQPAYRRIFSSKELGSAYVKEIAAGSESPFSVAFRVNSDVSENMVRGYRLLVFYP